MTGTCNCAFTAEGSAAGGAGGMTSGCGLEGRAWFSTCVEVPALTCADQAAKTLSATTGVSVQCMWKIPSQPSACYCVHLLHARCHSCTPRGGPNPSQNRPSQRVTDYAA